MKQAILLIITLFLIAGCSSLQVTKKMAQINRGMTKAEVAGVLGSPNRIGSIATSPDGHMNETWIYEEKIKKGAGKVAAKTAGYIVTLGGLAVSDSIMENYTQRKDMNVYEFSFVDGVLHEVRSQRGERAPGYVVGVNINQTQEKAIQ